MFNVVADESLSISFHIGLTRIAGGFTWSNGIPYKNEYSWKNDILPKEEEDCVSLNYDCTSTEITLVAIKCDVDVGADENLGILCQGDKYQSNAG